MKSKKILPLVLMLSTVALGSCGGKSSSTPAKPNSTTPIQNNSSTPAPFVDTREFMLVGSGIGAEQELTWNWKFDDPTNPVTPTEHIKLNHKEGENVYTITVNLYQNDQFKIVSTKGWNDGTISISNLQAPGDHLEDAGTDGNIKVKTSAVYTLTLTTTAANAAVLSYTKGEDLPLPEFTYSYQLKGSWDEWATLKDMVVDKTTTTLYTIEMTFAAGDEFGVQVNKHIGEKVLDGGFLNFNNVVAGTEGFVKATNGNIVCETAGTYTVSLDTNPEKAKPEISFTLKTSGDTTDPGTTDSGDSGNGTGENANS